MPGNCSNMLAHTVRSSLLLLDVTQEKQEDKEQDGVVRKFGKAGDMLMTDDRAKTALYDLCSVATRRLLCDGHYRQCEVAIPVSTQSLGAGQAQVSYDQYVPS